MADTSIRYTYSMGRKSPVPLSLWLVERKTESHCRMGRERIHGKRVMAHSRMERERTHGGREIHVAHGRMGRERRCGWMGRERMAVWYSVEVSLK